MIADFLKKLSRPDPQPLDDADARLALTALLVRLAKSDGVYSAPEIARIEAIAATRYALPPDAARDLRVEAEAVEAEVPDTVRFTRAIKDAVPYEARAAVVESLWQVALADGARDAGEDALIRLAVKFLGINHRDSAPAHQRVQKSS